MTGFRDLPVIDAHVHLAPSFGSLVNGREILEATKCRALNIVCVPHLAHITNDTAPVTPTGILFKALNPGRAYLFPGLTYPANGIEPDSKTDFTDQVRRAIRMGADGIKMHEGKPTVRRMTGIPLDAPVYDDLYQLLEEEQFPIVYHVGDPWIFWNPLTAPAYAHENGWVYTNGTCPDNSAVFGEVERVLERFPRLPVILAHFAFMSNDRRRATEFLERWPSVSLDLTPGVEMFPNFTSDWEAWREFFVTYGDRIILGTDNVGDEVAPNSANVARCMYRTYCVRNFLETDHIFRTWESVSHGFALGDDILRRIYHDNFARLAGSSPHELDLGMALEECRRAANLATGATRETQAVLHGIVLQLEAMVAAGRP